MNHQTETAYSPQLVRTLAPMVDHVGKALAAAVKRTGLPMDDVVHALPFSESQMYRHYKAADLSTKVLRSYEKTLVKLGKKLDLMTVLSPTEEAASTKPSHINVAEPPAEYKAQAPSSTPPVVLVISPGDPAYAEVLRKLIEKNG